MDDKATIRSAILEHLQQELQAEGYSVLLEPRGTAFGKMFDGYKPDIIALKDDVRIVFEIKFPGDAPNPNAEKLRAELSKYPGWLWQVRFVNASEIASLQPINIDQVRSTLSAAEQLSSDGHEDAALLLAWASFEAAGRLILPGAFGKPQTPARLVEVLASRGVLLPKEADSIRGLIQLRNGLIHGQLNMQPNSAEVLEFIAIQHALLNREPVAA